MGTILTINLWDRILQWYHGTVLYELVEHILQTYYTVKPVSYDKITLTVKGARTARNAILAVALGIMLAAVGIFYTRKYPGGFVRALLKANAHSPENAKTLAELGYFYSVGIRWNLKHGGVLTKTVVRAGDPEPPIPLELREAPAEAPGEKPEADPAEGEKPVTGSRQPFDFVSDRFYIPAFLRVRAEIRYTRKGSGVLALILTVVLAIVGSGLLCRYLPSILRFADWLL